MPKRLKDMDDEEVAQLWARLADDMASVQKELSRRGLWRNYQETQDRLKAAVEKEARTAGSSEPKNAGTARSGSTSPAQSTKTAAS
jgi:hypothetical protein